MNIHAVENTGIFTHLSTGLFPLSAISDLRDNSAMSDERELLAKRIKQRLEELGITARALSIEATGKPDAVRDILRHKSTPSAPTLARIADSLETTSDWLIGRASQHEALLSEVTVRDVPQGWRGPTRDGIPVLATGYCDDLLISEDDQSLSPPCLAS